MKKLSSVLVAASLVMTLVNVAHAADRDRAARAEFDDRVRSMNQAAAKNHAMDEALHGISVETGVPLEKLQKIHKDFPKTGPAGILVACVIADERKVDPEHVVKQAVDGRTWTSLALEYKTPFEKIEARLNRLETYIKGGGDQKVPKAREKRG